MKYETTDRINCACEDMQLATDYTATAIWDFGDLEQKEELVKKTYACSCGCDVCTAQDNCRWVGFFCHNFEDMHM